MNLSLIAVLALNFYVLVTSRPHSLQQNDSPVSTIVIPYAPYTTDLVKDSKGKIHKVYVPVKMDVAPIIKLQEGQIAMGSQKGGPLNIAEGAYPVYYMLGNVNGQFRDKTIYILE